VAADIAAAEGNLKQATLTADAAYYAQQQNAEVTARAKLVAAFIDSRVGLALAGQPAVVDGELNPKATAEIRKQIVGIANFIAQAYVDVHL